MTDKKTTKKAASKKAEKDETPDELELQPSAAFSAKLNGDAPSVLNPEIAPVVVDAPSAPAYKIDLDDPATLVPLMRDAWNDVKGKGDADFDSCAGEFKGTLLAHALGVLKTKVVLEGDTNLAKFENEIAKRS